MGEDIPDGLMAPLPKRSPPRRAKDLTPAQLAKAITAAENRLCRLLSEAFSDGHNRMVNNFRVRIAAEEAQKALVKAHPTSATE